MNWRDNYRELQKRLAMNIFLADGLKFGSFFLKSGAKSPYYIDERELLSSRGKVRGQDIVRDVIEALYLTMKNEIGLDNIDLVIGVPETIVPYVGCITYAFGIPSGYTVKEVKTHGITKYVQAKMKDGDKIVLADDLITSGTSIAEALDNRIAMQCDQDKFNVTVDHAVVLVDRMQGGISNMKKHITKYSPKGIDVHPFMTVIDMIEILKDASLMTIGQYNDTKNYIADPKSFQ